MRLVPFTLVALCAFITVDVALAENKAWNGPSVGYWTNPNNWDPWGIPQNGDAVFITTVDPNNKIAFYDESINIPKSYSSILIESSGVGSIQLYQYPNTRTLVAGSMTISLYGRSIYDMEFGSSQFGLTTLNPLGWLHVAAGAFLTSTNFNHNGGSFVVNGAQVNVPGTYTLNSGSFDGTANSGTTLVTGTIAAGSFTTYLPDFGGSVDVSNKLNINVASLSIAGDFYNRMSSGSLAAGKTLNVRQRAYQIGGTFTQQGDFIQSLSTFGGLPSPDLFMSSGANWIQQSGNHTASTLVVGSAEPAAREGSPATYNLTGNGTANFNVVYLGPLADGSFNQSAGTVLSDGIVVGGGTTGFGFMPGGFRGYYNMSGGILKPSLDFMTIIIGQDTAIGGVFTQSAGSTTCTRLEMNQNSTSSGVLTLSGGSFHNSGRTISNGSFTQTGGVATFDDNFDGAGSMTITGNASLTIARIQQDSLSVGGNARIQINKAQVGTIGSVTATTSRVNTLNFEQVGNLVKGTFDIAGGKLIVNYDTTSPAANIRKYLTSGYNGGSWNGTGLSSIGAAGSFSGHHTALGYGEASQVLGASGGVFGGMAVDGTAVLVRYTYYGDANIDGSVDSVDFNSIASNFGGSGKSWSQGDSNYDGVVDTTDFNLLASNFGKTLAAEAASPVGSPVPEPAGISGAVLLMLALYRRCRNLQRSAHSVASRKMSS